jgi:undecaprenol kinase/diacylglycerol kinase (ATP)
MTNKRWKNKNFFEALNQSIKGIQYVLKNERNIRIQILFAIIAIIFGIIFKLSGTEFMILFFTIGLVIFAEIMNSAIEFVFDLYSEEYNEKIKIGKNIASGAVLSVAVISIIIGSILFIPKIILM